MGAMKETVERLRAAWYVLRGWSVVRGVSFTYGEVDRIVLRRNWNRVPDLSSVA